MAFGSSRLLDGFLPRVVERELAQRGLALRTFNLAYEGMRGFETAHLVRQVLADRPARLCYVVVEWQDFDPAYPYRRSAYTDRSVWWHAPRESWLAIRTALEGDSGAL